jgi:hypothetical protein
MKMTKLMVVMIYTINLITYTNLVIARYHATKGYLCMLVDMVENSLKHFTANIVKVHINSIREIPANS